MTAKVEDNLAHFKPILIKVSNQKLQEKSFLVIK